MQYIIRIPIHCLAYRVALPIQLFPLTCRWHSGHQIGSSLPGDCGYDAPIVPDGVTLSSTQQWFVEMYQQSEGWYLLPPWHFMNMAQACMLAFGMCLVLLVIMSGAWALKIIRG